MRLYELLILAHPYITEDEIDTIEKELDTMIKKENGTSTTFDRWGKCKLAYPISEHRYGVYCLLRFQIKNPYPLFTEIRNFFTIKYHETVFRFMIHGLSPKDTESYQRPESVQEIPTHDVSSFLRENKMEGLLSSVGGEGRLPRDKRKESTLSNSHETLPSKQKEDTFKKSDDDKEEQS